MSLEWRPPLEASCRSPRVTETKVYTNRSKLRYPTGHSRLRFGTQVRPTLCRSSTYPPKRRQATLPGLKTPAHTFFYFRTLRTQAVTVMHASSTVPIATPAIMPAMVLSARNTS